MFGDSARGKLNKRQAASAITAADGVLITGKRSGGDIMKLIAEKVEQKSKNVRVVFRKFDEDSSGSVNAAEFRAGLASLGIALADNEFNKLMAIVDADGGGCINYGEFAQKLKAGDSQTVDMFGDSSRGFRGQRPMSSGSVQGSRRGGGSRRSSRSSRSSAIDALAIFGRPPSRGSAFGL